MKDTMLHTKFSSRTHQIIMFLYSSPTLRYLNRKCQLAGYASNISPLELQIVSVILGEEIVVNADCMNQESSPPYRVQIRIAPVHPRIGVVDGGRRHLVVIHVLRPCRCQSYITKWLTTIPATWLFHLHMRS